MFTPFHFIYSSNDYNAYTDNTDYKQAYMPAYTADTVLWLFELRGKKGADRTERYPLRLL